MKPKRCSLDQRELRIAQFVVLSTKLPVVDTSRAVSFFGLSASCVLLSALAPSCERKQAPSADESSSTASAEPRVLLQGRFSAVGKAASGSVTLVERGDAYELVLDGVHLSHEGDIRVYLVGLDSANTTAAVDGAKDKYDLGSLDLGQNRQVITLPSKPAPKLRSVVLWNAKYGANLAAASLN